MKRNKTTGLQRLRIARAHMERPIREPLEREIAVGARMIRELGHQLEQLRRFMGAEISKHVIGTIGHEVSSILKREILTALMVAGRSVNSHDIVRMEFAASDLRWATPDSIERRVLDDWKERSAPRLRVAFPKDGTTMMTSPVVTTIDVRIPELGYRRYIDDRALEHAR